MAMMGRLIIKLFNSVLSVGFVCGLALAVLFPAEGCAGGGFVILHKFHGGNDGEFPEAGLTADTFGILYGTTFGSLADGAFSKHCSKGCGNQYEYNGGNITTQHFFTGGGDGAFPTGEVAVQNGAIYGTTEYGGATSCGGLGCGTAFLLPANRSLPEKVFEFCYGQGFPACVNGALPHAGVILDGDGNAYGTTTLGGTGTGYQCDSNFGGCGTVYMLAKNMNIQGNLQETVLYNFCSLSQCADGAIPLGRLWRDTAGDLYGTTQFGGDYGAGVIFELQLSNGKYSYQKLYSFCQNNVADCPDGAIPEAGLIQDDAGNLYGTASSGGGGSCTGSSSGCGALFKLATDGTYTVLHSFKGESDGALPQAQLVLDDAGNLYGTTLKGGAGNYCKPTSIGCGTVFKLRSDGTSYKRIYVFGQKQFRPDGDQPEGVLLLIKNHLYGATRVFGDPACICGTLFRLSTGNNAPKRSWRGHGLPPRRANSPDQTAQFDRGWGTMRR